MATIVLSAVGGAAGASVGGSLLGLSGAVIGRAAGAVVGRMIDQRLLGLGSEAVETGRIDRLRLTGASEGSPIARQWGRVRVAGQVIWASRFREDSTTTGGGKGSPQPEVTEFSYSISLALALGKGEILGIGRIWADGEEIAQDDLQMRVYTGSNDQLPDPKMEAVEGQGMVPAYRGTAYVVFEDLALGRFGNRVPQLSFEVLRAADAPGMLTLSEALRGVALIPGTGEYSLATTPVHYDFGPGEKEAINVNSPSGATDMATSIAALGTELPRCEAVAMVVSWFGDDLRAGECRLGPKVEQAEFDGVGMPWRVSGLSRGDAREIAELDDRPVYGGTPADAAVIEGIAAIHARGQEVLFYPFLLMEQLEGNGLPDPWSDADEQPPLPWRGRITTAIAPGRDGTSDRTAEAEEEVAAFFGQAQPGDFTVEDGTVRYDGPEEWSLRRMILHYAHLCAAAGGVEAFCIGSEFRSLTQIRGAGDSFPAVEALRALAQDVRAIVGPDCKISYAADWSEYFGYDAGDGNRYFHLDPLWADEAIDFVAIDNYMPLSDWRDGDDHHDADWGSIYDLDYLMANVAGGEGYDWFYDGEQARQAQRRTPITDGAYGEPWVWRYKDLLSWWSNPHHERRDGVRAEEPTAWEPRSKPFWFTEYGCAAIDKGTNQPNKFLDPKSSESQLPYHSNGRRDDYMQMQYLRAMNAYWGDPANNPVSEVYGGPMVEMDRAFVWAWDARPFPRFPGNTELWTDGENWARGHWITGRAAAQPLDAVVTEICRDAGIADVDVSGLHGLVRGYDLPSVETARAALQPLMLAHGIEVVERGGKLRFAMRASGEAVRVDPQMLAVSGEGGGLETARAPDAETSGRVQLTHVEAEGDFEARAAEAVMADEPTTTVSRSELPLVLTRAEGRAAVERWLAEARAARDTARFALPPSCGLGAGDLVEFEGAGGVRRYRIDRVETTGALEMEAVRVESEIYTASDAAEERVVPRRFAAPVPVDPVFLDLPLLTGDEVAHAPHVAATARPWPGSVAVYSSREDNGYVLNTLLERRAAIGVTQTPLMRAAPGRWDRGPRLRVRIPGAALASVSRGALLDGANLLAIGSGSDDQWELLQFAEAELMEGDTYELSMRLRGQLGTDAVMPDAWPVGSTVVLIDRALAQIELARSARSLVRHYRIGPARRSLDDPSYVHEIRAFDGIGLRPYSPVHLRAERRASGDVAAQWIRRTRIDGDSWSGREVPLGEESESYAVRVLRDGAVAREVVVSAPEWVYPQAAQEEDGTEAGFTLAVAQISERFGPGPFASRSVAG